MLKPKLWLKPSKALTSSVEEFFSVFWQISPYFRTKCVFSTKFVILQTIYMFVVAQEERGY